MARKNPSMMTWILGAAAAGAAYYYFVYKPAPSVSASGSEFEGARRAAKAKGQPYFLAKAPDGTAGCFFTATGKATLIGACGAPTPAAMGDHTLSSRGYGSLGVVEHTLSSKGYGSLR